MRKDEIEESKNNRAKELVGLRKEGFGKNAIIIDFPCELGFHCPVCKYKQEINGEYDERLEWSEYNGFIWCSVCNRDYPSVLCQKNIEKAIDVYLDCIEEVIERIKSNPQLKQ